MNFSFLTALSPLDGRYGAKVSALRPYFSEFALIRYRVHLEIEWFKALSQDRRIVDIQPLSPASVTELDSMAANFTEADAEEVKLIEGRTNHDVKAVEYWLRERFARNARVHAKCAIHPFCLHLRRHQQSFSRIDAVAQPRQA